MNQEFYNKLCKITDEKYIKIEEPMKNHTTFRVGGPAEYFVEVNSKESLVNTIQLCKEYGANYHIIGNGSNLLVSDAGIRGVVIQVYKQLNEIEVKDKTMVVQAGALLNKVARTAQNHELTGMEFAAGIPGTIGGAVAMNAGAYGGEMKDIVERVTVVTIEGELKTYEKQDLEFGYRHSIISERGDIVVEVELQLQQGDAEEMKRITEELKHKRVSKQPLEFPSAGSTFKRPEGHFAGKLIEDAGLRGYAVGGAQVSEKHCGFVINRGDATASDIVRLIEDVQAKVKQLYDVELELEVRKIGDF